MLLTKNVYMVSGQPYSSFQNVYAFKGPEGIVIIDSGADERECAIINNNLKQWGLKEVTHLILTHAHMTHTSNAHVFRERGIKTVAGVGAAEEIETGGDGIIDYDCETYKWHQSTFVPCPIDIRVKDGDVINAAGLKFHVNLMNGHSNGCIVLELEMDGTNILITGDVLCAAPNNAFAVLGWTVGIDYDHATYIEDIRKLSEMKPDILLGGHYQPCLVDAWKITKNAWFRMLKFQHPDLNRDISW